MDRWAEYSDGTTISKEIFTLLAHATPSGIIDVFASDQHNSYLKLASSYFTHIRVEKKPDDEDVRQICLTFAPYLKNHTTAVLFNHLAYQRPGFRELLGKDIMLIGRLEDSFPEELDHGMGKLARLSIEPEEAIDQLDAFKIMLILNPSHRESWEKNQAFAEDLFQRAQKLHKPLFTETVLMPLPGESKREFAARLPEDLVAMAESFGSYGHFYKTQVPILWYEENGIAHRASTPAQVRETVLSMKRFVPRPMLLLSAAVDFEQYAAQYGIVCDLVSGPMCGRAYFKESFTDSHTKDWKSLGESFARIALPRIDLIRNLAGAMSRPWWSECASVQEEAKALVKESSVSRTFSLEGGGY